MNRFDERRRWAQPELTEGIGVVNTRDANGGRAFPRTSASYRLPDGTRNPVLVTRDGVTTIVEGGRFTPSKAARIAKLTGKSNYKAATKGTPTAPRDDRTHRITSADLPAIGNTYD